MQHRDVIIVGGGLAGAALAKVLAEAGLDVLVLEREGAFKDRVRGEEMHCWGVGEARKLGIYDLLTSTCANEIRYWSIQLEGMPQAPVRDLIETSPHRCGTLSFYHPDLQTVLLDAAIEAGATVHRGVRVMEVIPGSCPTVRVRGIGGHDSHCARLVIGADGRDSGCRKAGFLVESDPARASIAGLLLDGLDAPSDTVSLFINPTAGQFSMVIPLGGERFRAYVGYARHDDSRALSGERSLPDFLVTSIAAGAPAEWFEGAEPAGPLACFEGADRWVDHPYRDGVALIGDAAAASDPSFGCGTSLTLRDVRVLRDHLLANEDWNEAADAYATEHDRYYGALHRLTTWARTLFYDPQPEAAALRERAFPRLAEDPTRRPDFVGIGPEFPSDEGARRRFFGED